MWLENSADMPKLQEALTKAGAAYGVNVWEKGTVEPGSGNTWSAAFDTGLSQEQQLALSRAIDEALGDTDITWNYFRSYRAEAADDFYGTYGSLFFIGIVLFSFTTLFQLVTLPVEFNASARAIATIDGAGLLDEDELPGAKKVLRAAALTYVAALLMSLLQLMRFVLIFIGRGGRDQGGSQ